MQHEMGADDQRSPTEVRDKGQPSGKTQESYLACSSPLSNIMARGLANPLWVFPRSGSATIFIASQHDFVPLPLRRNIIKSPALRGGERN